MQKRSNQVWRRRACSVCKAVFTTHEAIDLSSALLVQNGANMEPFVTERLYSDILACMPHREDKYIAANEVTKTVVIQLTIKKVSTILTPYMISSATAVVLKALDNKAFLHYSANHL